MNLLGLNPNMSTDEKLQKVIARSGRASRRVAETWIEAGRVSVNGSLVGLGTRVTAADKIRIDGILLPESSAENNKTRVLVYNKPEGEVCTRSDPEGRKTVFDHLPRLENGRWILVGRLDINTSGLLLFTDNGELANRLMHPSRQVLRTYAVRIRGEVTDRMKQRLCRGVELEDGKASFDSIRDGGGEGSNHWFHVTLREGRNREVRRLWESQDVQVSRLMRTSFGCCELPGSLPRGRWNPLEPEALRALGKLVELELQPHISTDKVKRRLKTRQQIPDGRSLASDRHGGKGAQRGINTATDTRQRVKKSTKTTNPWKKSAPKGRTRL